MSAAQLLYTDGLHSIFRFLSLKDLLSAVHSCRSWRDAAYKEKQSRSVEVNLSDDRFPSLLSSPLRHHVTSFVSDRRAHLLFASISQLASRLPWLRSLDVRLSVAKLSALDAAAFSARVTALWPQRLERMSIRLLLRFPISPATRLIVTRVMADVVAALPRTLTDLDLSSTRPNEAPFASAHFLEVTRNSNDSPWIGSPMNISSSFARRCLSWSTFNRLPRLCRQVNSPRCPCSRICCIALRRSVLSEVCMRHK